MRKYLCLALFLIPAPFSPSDVSKLVCICPVYCLNRASHFYSIVSCTIVFWSDTALPNSNPEQQTNRMKDKSNNNITSKSKKKKKPKNNDPNNSLFEKHPKTKSSAPPHQNLNPGSAQKTQTKNTDEESDRHKTEPRRDIKLRLLCFANANASCKKEDIDNTCLISQTHYKAGVE